MKTLFAIQVLVLFLFTAPATYSISGMAPSAMESGYSLIRRDTVSVAGNPIRSLKMNRTDNRFEIQDVAPGIYDLYVLSSDADGSPTSGSIHLQIKNRNLSSVTIDMKPFVDIRGRFIVNRDVFTERSPRISLKPKDMPAPYWMQSMGVADEDGTFTLVDVAQGAYTLSVGGLSGGYRVAEIHLGGIVLQPSDSVSIGNDSQTMEIVVDRMP